MKKIFTYPENSSTNYYVDQAASDHMREIYTGTFLTNDLEDTPLTDDEVLQNWAKFLKYFEDRKHGLHLSRYDFWHYPLITGDLEVISHEGWKLLNPKLAPGSGEAARFTTIDGSDHGFRDGMMINFDYGSGNDSSLDESDYYTAVFVNVINSTTVDVYDSLSFLANAEPDTFSDPVDPFFMMSQISRNSRNFQTTRIYDSFPRVVQSDNRDMFRSIDDDEHIKDIQDRILAYSNNGTSLTNVPDAGWSDGNFMAPLLTGYYNIAGEDTYESRYMLALDDEYASIHTNPAERSISHSGRWSPGGDPVADYPSYSHTYSASGTDGSDIITHTGHGLVNGDVVNVTSIRGGFLSARSDDLDHLHRGGCGNVYFVDRIDNNSYRLTLLPYRANVSDRGYVEVQAQANNQYDWDSDTAISGSTTGITLSVRKAALLDDSYLLHIIEDVIRPVTTGIDHTVFYHYRNSGTGGSAVFSSTAEIEDDRVDINPNLGEPLPYRLSDVQVSWPGNATFDTLTVSPDSWYVEGYHSPVVADVGRGAANKGGRTRTPDIPTITVSTTNNKVSGVSFSGENRWPWSYNGRDTSGSSTDPLYKPFDAAAPSDGIHSQQSHRYKVAFILSGYSTPAAVTKPGAQLYPGTFESSDWDAGNYTETEAGTWYWPDHIAPRTATINMRQPSSTNISNSGIKYARTSGIIKYDLDLEYPAMREKDFARFMAAVQAARGQLRPFRFPLRFINRHGTGYRGILFNNPEAPDLPGKNPRLYTALADGDKKLYLEGYGSEEDIAVYPGQHFRIPDSNRNGGLHTNVLQQKSNIYGQVVANLAYPVQLNSSIAAGTAIEDQPEYCMVTINEDEFVYKTDYSGLYNFSIQLTLDEAKD